MLVAKDSLSIAAEAEASITAQGAVFTFTWVDRSRFTWVDRSSTDENSDGNDLMMPLVYNEDKNEVIYQAPSVKKRVEGTMTLSLPAHWAGDTIQVYLAVKGKEGKKVSDSVYLGEHTAV